MKKVLVKRHSEGLPIDLIGKIIQVDETYKIIEGGIYDGMLLNPSELSIVTYDEPDELLNKVLKGEHLTDSELEELFWEYDDICVKHYKGENRRWSSYDTKLLNIYGRYFIIGGDIALTESGEHMFVKQPYEVEFKPRLIQDVIFELTIINKTK